jgi:hypothetical protein
MAGDADCEPGSWCEPLEIDPATNRWLGICSRRW